MKMGFSEILDCQMSMIYDKDGWSNLKQSEFYNKVNGSNHTLNYAQSVFEGIKLHRINNDWYGFRFLDHIDRLENSLIIMGMPRLPKNFIEQFSKELKKIQDNFDLNADYVYIRPVVYSIDHNLAVRTANNFRLDINFCLLNKRKNLNKGFMVAEKFSRSNHVSLAKWSGRYALSFPVEKELHKNAKHTALWLDQEGRLEEFTSMNIFLIKGSELITSKNYGNFLKGITRKTIIENFKVIEKEIYLENLLKYISSGYMVFGTGTAVDFMFFDKMSVNNNQYNIYHDDKKIDKFIKDYFSFIYKNKKLWIKI